VSSESAVIENASFFFRSLYLPYEVHHWLYISKFTRLRAVSRRQHGSCKTICLKNRASTPNDSTRKTVFNARQNGSSRSFKVIYFNVDENPLEDYIFRHDNLGLVYEILKDSGHKKQKWQFSTTPLSFDAPCPANPNEYRQTLVSLQSRVSVLHFRRW